MTWAHIALALSPFIAFDLTTTLISHNTNTPTPKEQKQ